MKFGKETVKINPCAITCCIRVKHPAAGRQADIQACPFGPLLAGIKGDFKAMP